MVKFDITGFFGGRPKLHEPRRRSTHFALAEGLDLVCAPTLILVLVQVLMIPSMTRFEMPIGIKCTIRVNADQEW
jgi:hypothetical protein